MATSNSNLNPNSNTGSSQIIELSDAFPDEYWMAKAIALAKKGRFTTTPNPNVGCVIVKDGRLLGEGFHQQAGTAHAEVHALKQAGRTSVGATAYVTLEPCSHQGKTPPCCLALIQAGISRVVCAMMDPNPLVAGQGISKLEDAGVQVRVGVLGNQAESINLGFLKRMRTGHPFVVAKMASSLDGGTAMANGESKWITGAQARSDVQWGRVQSCAIVTGVDTVITDDPSMNVRLNPDQLDTALFKSEARQPARIILDSNLRMPLDAKLIRLPGEVIVIYASDAGGPNRTETIKVLNEVGVITVELPTRGGRIDLNAFMQWCGDQAFNQLWIEAGATLTGAFISEQLVDEVILYQAPCFLGANARPVMGIELGALAEAIRFNVIDVRTVGKDVRWRLQPVVDNT